MNLSIPKGTRDFGPKVMGKRNYIFNTIKAVFEKFGYQPIETPSMENLDTLLGKYGEEGDRLIFKILNSGNFLENFEEKDFTESPGKLATKLCEKGLRYDLTVPFARFVVMHRNDIEFPFKRYQIQPVWRADRPQKGRYREFYQCDVDVIGSKSLLNEAELIQVIDEVFSTLRCNVIIKINNRKILSGISELIGAVDKITDITVAIDKLEKIGMDGVKKELREKGLTEEAILMVEPLLIFSGSNKEKINKLKTIFESNETGKKGIAEIEEILKIIQILPLQNKVEVDITLARGLNYYTGAIFEVKASDAAIGSICGGGRYDDLTGIFGMPDTSGVGVSFGADRIYDVMTELNLFPDLTEKSTTVMFANFGEKEMQYCLEMAYILRNKGISCELYPDISKLKKQLSYANAKKIKWVVMVGEDEMKSEKFTVKNLEDGVQSSLNKNELLNLFIS